MFLSPFINKLMTAFAILFAFSFFISFLFLTTIKTSWVVVFEFFKTSSTVFEFPVILDPMSTLFFSFVLLISSTVLLYSSSYMSNDPLNKRFTLLVLLFIMSMMFLIFTLNIIAIMLGWDGLGLISFLLVAYYQNTKSNSASMITALSNRIGDSAILVLIALMIQTNSWNFMYSPLSSFSLLMVMFLILAAMTKSAQMPFSAWLPAAMAAPTPVSALVHSSTLVTAGIYLLIRFHPLIMKLSLNTFLIYMGLLTSIMASLSACAETNLKKTVALSTLSQLGLMTATLAIGFQALAFFHLLTHAAFKALLFIACGKIIHESNNTQDIRAMGALMNKTPFTWLTLNISNFALCGIPFMAGFYSKDLLYQNTIMNLTQYSVLLLFSMAIALSTIYSVRMMFASMSNYSLTSPLFSASEKDLITVNSMKMLAIPAVTAGSLVSWLFFNKPYMICLPFLTMILPILFLLTCFSLGLLLSFYTLPTALRSSNRLEPLIQMWFLPTLSSSPSKQLLYLSTQTKYTETGWFEILTAHNLFYSSMLYSMNITKSQTYQTSTLLMLFATTLMITLLSTQSS